MLRYVVRTAVIAVVACSSPTGPVGPVELTTTPYQSIRMANRTSEPVFYFAIECNAAALANWAVCTNPAACPSVRSGESRLIPFSEIAFYSPGSEAALVYWWHLRPASGGAFAPDSIRAVRVPRIPSARLVAE